MKVIFKCILKRFWIVYIAIKLLPAIYITCALQGEAADIYYSWWFIFISQLKRTCSDKRFLDLPRMPPCLGQMWPFSQMLCWIFRTHMLDKLIETPGLVFHSFPFLWRFRFRYFVLQTNIRLHPEVHFDDFEEGYVFYAVWKDAFWKSWWWKLVLKKFKIIIQCHYRTFFRTNVSLLLNKLYLKFCSAET